MTELDFLASGRGSAVWMATRQSVRFSKRNRDGIAFRKRLKSSAASWKLVSGLGRRSLQHYSGCPQIFPDNFVERDISFSVSVDQGATWAIPISLASGCLVAPVPAVAANGDLFVVWYDCNLGNSAVRQMVRKSTDGGISFQPAVPAASGLTAPPNPLIGSGFRVNAAFPSITTDPTNANNVYVVWSSDNGPSQTDVFFARSLDEAKRGASNFG